jgi:hypothetical protein
MSSKTKQSLALAAGYRWLVNDNCRALAGVAL